MADYVFNYGILEAPAAPRAGGVYLPELDRTCHRERCESAPMVNDPAVGADGRAYVQVRQLSQEEAGDCVASDATTRHDDHRVQLVAVEATGVVTSDTLYTYTGDTPVPGCGGWVPAVGQTVPDGQEGVLATWSRSTCGATPYEVVTETRVTRRAADGTLAEHAFPADTTIAMTGDAATAYLTPQLGGTVTAVEVTTWATKWSTPAAGTLVTPGPDGAVAVHDPMTRTLTTLDAMGVVSGSTVVAVDSPRTALKLGAWHGLAPVTRVLTEVVGRAIDSAPFSFVAGRGDDQGSNSVRPVTVDNRNGTSPLLLKFERDGEFQILLAGQISRDPIDGVKPDAWRLPGAPSFTGDWYKVPTGLGVFVGPDGQPARIAPTVWAIPLLALPECDFDALFCVPTAGISPLPPYEYWGGRKKEPEWSSELQPNWRHPWQ